ncbi:Wzz/FepE/Etk N-terminal domain-containing protein [Clostridium perfringens]|uniref:YveK family protein n=1 Tax=Clostridium perfringens TaxID=1502 RepID=UPI001A1EC671|nr:Wzz/FepE/Etk N-terminal domain-containing protein [Clostridium perfringens]MDH2475036.1 Wzz/FepE/Etk N-terminal domain-containing protein [Clostridium perfringens]MDK0609918.1 Wzz/FepE/Etk N-terminal domain-containing protein [Clostridium perfringens]MDK0674466.1 Wzz/FepE/Etk N-terminal domain-containing protein [Clostridium perfringens]MDM0757244.1 Wzz/FepE/Etk N-terminal domain-containing protein [Clostridium perfringens]HAT4333748.1 capsular biosynthesis protein [Clostridium perfringens]
MEENTISLQEIAYTLKKRWKVIVLITIAATLVSAILSFFVIKPQYEASTKLFIGKQENQENNAYNNSDVMMYQQLMKTYAELVKTSDLVTKAVKSANLDYDQNEIKGILNNLTATPSADTQILDLSFKGREPKEVLKVTEAITDEFIAESKNLIPNGNVQVIQKPQLPKYPVSPNKKLNIIISFLLGIMVGVGVVLLLEYLDNTFKSREELEKTLELPIIGTIPDYDNMGK